MYIYQVKLNKPVEPNKIEIGSNEGTMTGLTRKLGNDQWLFQWNHSPGANAETRRVEIYRLPKGAVLVSIVPKDLPHQTKNGQIEITTEKMVPAGGTISVSIRYKLADTQGL
jgi:hypothetical protein